MKASNPKVMIQAYRLLVERMAQEDMHYPLHLGVTEAGDGEDGRIKSAIGIGSLLLDGLGDTIRVSLTEDSVYEIPVARAIADKAMAAKPWPSLAAGRQDGHAGRGPARAGGNRRGSGHPRVRSCPTLPGGISSRWNSAPRSGPPTWPLPLAAAGPLLSRPAVCPPTTADFARLSPVRAPAGHFLAATRARRFSALARNAPSPGRRPSAVHPLGIAPANSPRRAHALGAYRQLANAPRLGLARADLDPQHRRPPPCAATTASSRSCSRRRSSPAACSATASATS